MRHERTNLRDRESMIGIRSSEETSLQADQETASLPTRRRKCPRMTYLYIHVEKKQRDCQTAQSLALLFSLHVRTSAVSYRYMQLLTIYLPLYKESATGL